MTILYRYVACGNGQGMEVEAAPPPEFYEFKTFLVKMTARGTFCIVDEMSPKTKSPTAGLMYNIR